MLHRRPAAGTHAEYGLICTRLTTLETTLALVCAADRWEGFDRGTTITEKSRRRQMTFFVVRRDVRFQFPFENVQ